MVPIILEPGRQEGATAFMGSKDSKDFEELGFDTFLYLFKQRYFTQYISPLAG